MIDNGVMFGYQVKNKADLQKIKDKIGDRIQYLGIIILKIYGYH